MLIGGVGADVVLVQMWRCWCRCGGVGADVVLVQMWLFDIEGADRRC